MATISSTLKLNDQMSKTFSSINRAMNSTLVAMRSIEGVNLGEEFAQAAADIKLAGNAIDQMNKNLVDESVASAGGISALRHEIDNVNSTLAGTAPVAQAAMNSLSAISGEEINAVAQSVEASLSMMGVDIAEGFDSASESALKVANALQGAQNAANIAATQAETYKNKLSDIADKMDAGAASIVEMQRQQDAAFSEGKQKKIDALIQKQDRLNESYSRTEALLQKASAAYSDQAGKIAVLSSKLAGLAQSPQSSGTDKLNQGLDQAVQKTEDLKRRAAKSPFDKWNAKVITINQALMLTRRIFNALGKGFSSILNATGKWEGVMNKFNESLNASRAALGEKLLPLAAVSSSVFASAFDWMAQKATEAIGWINDNIDLVINALALLGTAAAVAAVIFAVSWAVANWPIVLIIGTIMLLASTLTSFGYTASDILGFVGGLFGTLYAVIFNTFALIYNVIAEFINFFGNVFKDPIGAVKVLFYDLASTVIGYVVEMARAIEHVVNSIPGVEVSIIAGLEGFQKSIESAASQAKSAMEWEEFVKPMEYKDIVETAIDGSEFGSNIGAKLDGIGDSLGNFDLSKYTVPSSSGGGKALKTNVDNKIEMSGEDIKLMLDLAKEDYKVYYQTLTPQLSLNIDTVRENVDVDHVVEEIAVMLTEVTESRVVTA